MEETIRRLFFGLEVNAPWPIKMAPGRILDPENRHLTLAFLGKTDYQKLLKLLPHCPLPNWKLGLIGFFDRYLFLPPHHPHVVAYHVSLISKSDEDSFLDYQKIFSKWLDLHKIQQKSHAEFLPHLTICRRPFELKEWKKNFAIFPFYIHGLHLYESQSYSIYKKLWSHFFIPPFQEIEHTADVAFLVRGQTIKEIYLHAKSALSFLFPPLINFFSEENSSVSHLDDIVIELNSLISKADEILGSPFKAVSFHGELSLKNEFLEWEMIIDV